MGRLQGKRALVTGGGSGIGAGIARRFAAEGAHVILAQRSADKLERTAAAIRDAGGSAETFVGDVSTPAGAAALAAAAVERAGRLDILINNAARTGRVGPFLDVTLDDWHSYIDTNLTGAFVVAQAAARHMAREGIEGRIVNLGSVDSFAAEAGAAPYAASKGGLWLLTRAMAVDLAPYGIAVNLIAPGPIRVERTAARARDPELRAARAAVIPQGAYGQPADVAAAAVYLASDECRYTTGGAITVDGGGRAFLPF